jgi:hypothetical protein
MLWEEPSMIRTFLTMALVAATLTGAANAGDFHFKRGTDYYDDLSGAFGAYPNGIDNYGLTNFRCINGGHGCRTCSGGNCQYRFYGQPDLFYNYYAWPSCGGVGAELYLSPRPVPAHVGHTFITYQPLYPHEFLYSHHRTYHRYYNGGQGLNRTKVHWYSPLFRK